RMDGEHAGVHLHARGDSEDWDTVRDRDGDIPGRAVSPAEHDELGPARQAPVDGLARVRGARPCGRNVDHCDALGAYAGVPERSLSHVATPDEPGDVETGVAFRGPEERIGKGARPGDRDGFGPGREGLIRGPIRPLEAQAASEARNRIHDEADAPHAITTESAVFRPCAGASS